MTIDPPDKSDPTTELPAVAPPEADSPSAETTPSPTVTAAQLLAEEIAAAIDAIAEKVPQFQFAHPSTASHVRYARTVSRDFIASMAYTVEAKQELRRTFDPDDAREMLQVTEALRPVTDRLANLLTNLIYSLELRKAKVVAAAMTTYALAKALARDPGGEELIPFLAILRRDLGRKKPKKPKPE